MKGRYVYAPHKATPYILVQSCIIPSAMLCAALLLLVQASIAAEPTAGFLSKAKNNLDSSLDMRISHFACENASAQEFTDRVRDLTGVRVCLVCSSLEWGPEGVLLPFSLDMRNVTAREILNAAIQQRPEYEWSSVKVNLVNLIPSQEKAEAHFPGNVMLEEVVIDGLTAQQAYLQILDLSRNAPRPVTGAILTKSALDPLEARTIFLCMHDVSLLDALNSVTLQAGHDVSWTLSSKFITFGATQTLDPVFEELQIARDLAADEAKSSEAGRFYEAALDTCPYPELKAKIAVEYATYLMERIDGKIRDLSKAQLLYEQIWPELEIVPIYCRSELLSGRLHAMVASGHKADADQLLNDVYKSPAQPFGEIIPLDQLVNIEFFPTPTGAARPLSEILQALENKRNLLPDNAAFQSKLEDSISQVKRNQLSATDAGDDVVESVNQAVRGGVRPMSYPLL